MKYMNFVKKNRANRRSFVNIVSTCTTNAKPDVPDKLLTEILIPTKVNPF